MAYYNIEKRLKSDGTPRYRCNVIIKEKGVITYRESKTFPKHAHAKTWGTQKVMELDLYGIPSSNAVDGLTVRDLLHKYLNDPNAGGKAGRTKRYVLELLMDSDISAIKLSELTENDVIEHCRLRNNAGAGPATVSHDVSYLGSVLDAAKPVYGINYTSNPAKSARPYLLKLGLIGKSNVVIVDQHLMNWTCSLQAFNNDLLINAQKFRSLISSNFLYGPVCESEKYAGYDGKISTRNKNLYS